MSVQITPEFLEQLEDLIQYVWEDEEVHWEEAGRPDNHIFVKIKKLNDWLAGVTKADVRSLTQRPPDKGGLWRKMSYSSNFMVLRSRPCVLALAGNANR